MDQTKLREFTERYLNYYQCKVIENAPTHLITQLSIEIDKDLLNRPLYWMYVERMGLEPQPATLTFIFDPDRRPADLRGEYLFFGAPRFKMMLSSAQKKGRFTRLYQLTNRRPRFSNSLPYVPWLGVNFKVSYVCDQKKEQIHYLGINLSTGEIQENFYEVCQKEQWTNKLPSGRHLLPEKMPLAEAVSELEYFLEDLIRQEDHTWAEEAHQRYRSEMTQLEGYFAGKDLQGEEAKNNLLRKQELVRQYHPRVEVEVVNAGYFYRELNTSFYHGT